jgi:CRISPR-associated endonuclease Cas2
VGVDILKIPVLIIYDISLDKNRNRLAKELLYYGIRTQKSLFEAEVTEGQLKELHRIVDRYAAFSPDDTVALYIMDPSMYGRTKRMGDTDYLTTDDFII